MNTKIARRVVVSEADQIKFNADKVKLPAYIEEQASAVVLKETTLENAIDKLSGQLKSLDKAEIKEALSKRCQELQEMLDFVASGAAAAVADLGGKQDPHAAVQSVFASMIANGGSPGTLLGKLEAAGALIEKVVVTVPKAFKLRLDNHTELSFSAGTQTVAKFIPDHWYAKANGMKVFGSDPAPKAKAEVATVVEEEQTEEAPAKPIARRKAAPKAKAKK